MKRHGFTLVELLVVISIIALLISLLLPALQRAKFLALRIQCASNLRQMGVALQEYANEFGGYPMTNTNFYFQPFGGFRCSNNTVPDWGLSMLYNDSIAVSNGDPYGNGWVNTGTYMVNVRPGILTPNVEGISMIFSTQPGDISMPNQIISSGPNSYYNSAGLLTQWNFYSGYCYWVDRGTGNPVRSNFPQGFSQAYDIYPIELQAETGTSYYTYIDAAFYNTNTSHMPAENPQSDPGAILASDIAIMNPPLGGPENAPLGALTGAAFEYGVGSGNSPLAPASNHVDTPNNNYLPDGVHELYNDAAVVWQPMSQIKIHYVRKGLDFAW